MFKKWDNIFITTLFQKLYDLFHYPKYYNYFSIYDTRFEVVNFEIICIKQAYHKNRKSVLPRVTVDNVR